MKTKDEIFGGVALQNTTTIVPEWGGEVTIAHRSAAYVEQMYKEWQAFGKPEGDNTGFRAWCIAHTVVNEDGSLFFDPKKDLEQLNEQPFSIIDGVFDVTSALNKFTRSDREELVKN